MCETVASMDAAGEIRSEYVVMYQHYLQETNVGP